MKKLLLYLGQHNYRKQLVPFFVFSILGLVIWFAGPALWIANKAPLAQADKRLYSILAIILTWFLKKYFFDAQTPVIADPVAKPVDKKISSLEGKFQGAVAFLKKTFITRKGKQFKLSKLPWYLLVGPSGSGKTSLLANADINYILSKQFKKETLRSIPPSEGCDWWVTRDMVLVDVPSHYLLSKQKNPDKTAAPVDSLWEYFLKFIKKYRGSNAIAGIIVTLPLPELMSQRHLPKEKTQLGYLKERIKEVRAMFGASIPIHILITKCDLLLGFKEFFGDVSSDEISQTWGITLPTLKNNENVADVFSQRFSQLIKRLNKQLIWRIHQERNPFARPYVKDFPLQVERLKETILNVVKAFSVSLNQPLINGIYLTSALQPATQEKQSPIAFATTQSLQILKTPVMPTRPYFLKQLLLQTLFSHGPNVDAKPPENRKLVYSIAGGIMLMTTLFLANDFRHTWQQAHAIHQGLTEYQKDFDNSAPDFLKALPLLNALLESSSNPYSLFHYTDQATLSARQAYVKALQTIVLNEIKVDLENYLLASVEQNPNALYGALKAYLMLADNKHLQVDYVVSVLKNAAPDLFSHAHKSLLEKHLHNTFSYAWQPVTLNPGIIDKARKKLSELSNAELGFIILQNIGDNLKPVTLDFRSNNEAPVISINNINMIPKMFTGAAFSTIYNEQIDKIASSVADEDWIIGSLNTIPADGAPLIDQLRSLYVFSYVSIWEKVLSNLKLANAHNLVELNAIVSSLAGDKSQLKNLFNTIKENTSFAPVLAASPKLTELTTLIQNSTDQKDLLYKLFVSLNELHSDLQSIVNAPDMDMAAFKTASVRMRNDKINKDGINKAFWVANKVPAPFQDWLNVLAGQAWHFELASAAKVIETHWQTDVMQFYKDYIANRFPFFPNASEEVPIEKFKDFLGTHGVITRFYQNYIGPFTNMEDKRWQWKSVNNQQLPFSDVILSQLIHAGRLQRAFFPNGDDKLQVKFTLQAGGLPKNLKKFTMMMNGQEFQYEHEMPHIPQPVIWPGDKIARATFLSLVTADDATVTSDVKGEWSLFRLVNQSIVKMVNTKELILGFDVESYKVKYYLYTQGKMNPFLLGNLINFRLPDKLG